MSARGEILWSCTDGIGRMWEEAHRLAYPSICVCLFWEDAEELEESSDRAGARSELVYHFLQGVLPFWQLEEQIRDSNAELCHDGSRRRGSRGGRSVPERRDERVFQGQSVLLWQLLEVVDDLKANDVVRPRRTRDRSPSTACLYVLHVSTFVLKVCAANSFGSGGASGLARMRLAVSHA